MGNGEWCLECGLERAVTSAGRCGKCAIVSQSSDIAYELATLRARVEELEKECAWTKMGDGYINHCGSEAQRITTTPYNYCPDCGGKVRVAE